MHVICRTRASGKTSLLLQEAVDKGYIFVAHTYREIERLKKICRDSNNDEPEFWTYDQLLNDSWQGRRDFGGMVIDNVDMLLQQLAGPVEVKTIAINQDEADPHND